jgi:hypothetical protein
MEESQNKEQKNKEQGKKQFKYEYNHVDLGYGIHIGDHTIYGKHVALGKGSNMIHIYPYKIYIGDDHDNAIELNSEQQRIVSNILRVMTRTAESAAVEKQKEEGYL